MKDDRVQRINSAKRNTIGIITNWYANFNIYKCIHINIDYIFQMICLSYKIMHKSRDLFKIIIKSNRN